MWTQQEYTLAESAVSAIGNIEVTFPSGGSTINLIVQVMFEDITASGGQRMLN